MLFSVVYSLETAYALLISSLLSAIVLCIIHPKLKQRAKSHIRPYATEYYSLRIATSIVSVGAVLVFALLIFLDLDIRQYLSYHSAVTDQPSYAGSNFIMQAIFDYMAYTNGASDFASSIVTTAYDGAIVRLLLFSLVTYPTILGLISGQSSFLIPRIEYRRVFRHLGRRTQKPNSGIRHFSVLPYGSCYVLFLFYWQSPFWHQQSDTCTKILNLLRSSV